MLHSNQLASDRTGKPKHQQVEQRQKLPPRVEEQRGPAPCEAPSRVTDRLYFNSECDVCGRGLRILIDLLGREIACPHCNCGMLAIDSSLSGQKESTLERASRLLSQISSREAQARAMKN